MPSVTLPGLATIPYEDRGDGRPVVFIHGLLVDGSLWRHVAPAVAEHHRAIVPTLPLGSHEHQLDPAADATPPGLAKLVAAFIEALDLRDVVLVGNDTGGAISQLVAAHHPGRLGALVLTNCDTQENFLPPFFKPLQLVCQVPGAVWMLGQQLRLRALARSPLAYGWLSKRGLTDEALDAWLAPGRAHRTTRRDLKRVIGPLHKRHLQAAMPALRASSLPVTIAWAREDRFFKPEYGERLAQELSAELCWIDDSYTFSPLDRPDAVTEAVLSAAGARSTSPSAV